MNSISLSPRKRVCVHVLCKLLCESNTLYPTRPTPVFQEVKQEMEDKYAHSPGTKTAETKLLQKKENLSKSPYIFILPTQTNS